MRVKMIWAGEEKESGYFDSNAPQNLPNREVMETEWHAMFQATAEDLLDDWGVISIQEVSDEEWERKVPIG